MLATATPRATPLESVQALRGIAASSVVLFHLAGTDELHGQASFRPLEPFRYFGAAGVDLFFVISGFIIVWTNHGAFGQLHKVPKYLARRMTRIFPLYWVFFLLAFVMARAGLSRALDAASDPVNLVSIFFLLPLESVHIVPVSWTLTYELLFYAFFGLVLVLGRRWFVPLLVAWCTAVLVSVPFLPPMAPGVSMLHRFALVVLSPNVLEFALGCCVALALRRRAAPWPWAWLVCGVAVFAAGGVARFLIETAYPSFEPHALVLVALFGVGSAGILTGAVSFERASGATLPRTLTYLGDASYSLYLSHLFVFAALRRVVAKLDGPAWYSHWLWLLALLVGGVLGGLLVYRFVEKPLLARTTRWVDERFGTSGRGLAP